MLLLLRLRQTIFLKILVKVKDRRNQPIPAQNIGVVLGIDIARVSPTDTSVLVKHIVELKLNR